MSEAVVVALIGIAPIALGLLVGITVAVFNWTAIKGGLLRVTRISVAGVEVELDPEQLMQARPDVPVGRSEALGVVARAERLHDVLVGKRVLWVDDYPRGNDRERSFLRAAGIKVQNALSTEEGMTQLMRDQFDALITDMDRGTGQDGTALAEAVGAMEAGIPVICYLGKKDPGQSVPVEFFGLTDRPDELVHLLLDALEWKGGQP